MDSCFGAFGRWLSNRHRKRRLRCMLSDNRFPNGFRSMAQLSEGIGCNREATAGLLLEIGARKSENSDEWTLRK